MNQLKLLIFLSILISQTIWSKVPESDIPIVIIKNDWSSQIMFTFVLKNIYEDLGYKVEIKELKTKDQWIFLSKGWAHIQVEIWQGTMAEMYNKTLKEGNLVEVGTHSAKTREEWWYPSYMEKKCPGLPDWKALKKCHQLFSTEATAPSGRYLGGPWEKPDEARIRALDLDFKVEKAKDGDQLWVELDKAYKDEKPIILFNWTPNWVEDRFKGKFVEFPKYNEKCESDPSWGINKKWAFDCGNPKDGWLKKAAHKTLKEQWPCAFKILKNMDLSSKMISNGAALIDADKMKPEEAAIKWMNLNKKKYLKWIPKECTRQIK